MSIQPVFLSIRAPTSIQKKLFAIENNQSKENLLTACSGLPIQCISLFEEHLIIKLAILFLSIQIQ